jgi:hypothetical protein
MITSFVPLSTGGESNVNPIKPVILAAAFCYGTYVHAAVDLIAIGTLSGAYEDLSSETTAPLENGVAGNRLGGIGSGLAYAGGKTFLALPDRGPNAVSYDGSIDDTTSYIDRFHSFTLSLAPSDPNAMLSSDPATELPFVLTPTLRRTTLLSSRTLLVYGSGAGLGVGSGAPALNARHHLFYFTGRSDNFDPSKPSTDPRDGRLDPESIRVANDGESVFISDEYGPFVYQFDRPNGQRIRAFKLPPKFAVMNLSPKGDTEIGGNTSGRVANKGMEGLAITPDGKTLVGMMQSPLIQDGGTNAAFTRIITIDVHSGKTHEFAYKLENIGTATKVKYPTVSEIVAVNDHEFLVDERDGNGLGDGSVAKFKRLYRISLDGAADVTDIVGESNLAGKEVQKALFLDVVSALNAHGIASQDIPAKLEGLTFGPDVFIEGVVKHTLFVANDNDFTPTVTDALHPTGVANPNHWFVFAFDDNDLPGFEPQHFKSNSEHDDD